MRTLGNWRVVWPTSAAEVFLLYMSKKSKSHPWDLETMFLLQVNFENWFLLHGTNMDLKSM